MGGWIVLAVVGILIANIGYRWSWARSRQRECYSNGHIWITDGDGLYCRNCGKAPTLMEFRR